jgi:hypothetical protein
MVNVKRKSFKLTDNSYLHLEFDETAEPEYWFLISEGKKIFNCNNEKGKKICSLFKECSGFKQNCCDLSCSDIDDEANKNIENFILENI